MPAGSVFETHVRWRVPYILYVLHTVLVIEIVINCAAYLTFCTLCLHGYLALCRMCIPHSDTAALCSGYGSYLIHAPLPYCPTDPTTLWQPRGVGQVSPLFLIFLPPCIQCAVYHNLQQCPVYHTCLSPLIVILQSKVQNKLAFVLLNVDPKVAVRAFSAYFKQTRKLAPRNNNQSAHACYAASGGRVDDLGNRWAYPADGCQHIQHVPKLQGPEVLARPVTCSGLAAWHAARHRHLFHPRERF